MNKKSRMNSSKQPGNEVNSLNMSILGEIKKGACVYAAHLFFIKFKLHNNEADVENTSQKRYIQT